MTLPPSFRAAMGVGEGSMVELSLKNGKTLITPKLVIDRSQFQMLTTNIRRHSVAELADGLADTKAGRASKAFSNADDLIADLHNQLRD